MRDAQEDASKKRLKEKPLGNGFRNCKAVWEAGAAPLRRGDAGYTPKLDADNDGVACEVRPRY